MDTNSQRDTESPWCLSSDITCSTASNTAVLVESLFITIKVHEPDFKPRELETPLSVPRQTRSKHPLKDEWGFS